jgi:2-oxoisovalerate dehydrogenase E2 component (dihydrolipoyl transacylase)
MLKLLTRRPETRLFNSCFRRHFTPSFPLLKKVQFNVGDIGDGITECELIQWFIKEGNQVAQFDRLCEVQSDKATV